MGRIGRGSLTAAEKKKHDELSAKLAEATEKMKKYLARLSTSFQPTGKTPNEIQAANTRLQMLTGETSDLQHILAKLEPGTVAVYTAILPDKLSMIIITPQTMFKHEVKITEADLRTKIWDFAQLFSGTNPPSEDSVRVKGKALYQVLFEPDVVTAIKGARPPGAQTQTVMWSLDGGLRYVPIAVPYDGSQYLVERYRNVLITPDRSRLQEDTELSGATGLAMGVSKKYESGLEALSNVPDELDSVVHSEKRPTSHGPIPGTILLNDDFTEVKMKDSLSPGDSRSQNPAIVHIASHYVYELGDETSYLLFGGKEPGGQGFHLTLRDLDDPSIHFDNSQLVTLAACQTAVSGNNSDGHEIDSLGIELTKEKNAKSVIATLWSVADAIRRGDRQSLGKSSKRE